MSTNIANQVAFLPTTRVFSQNLDSLTLELNRNYVEIAQAVNNRTIAIFPKNQSALNGKRWFLNTGSYQSGQRQVYDFSSFTNFDHGLNLDSIDYFTQCYGQFTNGTDWYGLLFSTPTVSAGQVNFYIDPSQIVFVASGTAPAITKGIIILEWIPIANN